MSSIRSLIVRRRDEEEGFTLIELMVVVLIIAILIAIAIPTFLGARQRAQDRAAQSDLRNGLTAEKTIYTDAETFDATTAAMKAIEPSLNWNNGAAAPPAASGAYVRFYVGSVTVPNTVTQNVVCLDRQSKSGTTFAIADIAQGTNAGTFYAHNACPAAVDDTTVNLGTNNFGLKW